MKRLHGIIFLILFFLIIQPVNSQNNNECRETKFTAKGPLHIKDLYFLYLPFLSISPESAAISDAGNISILVINHFTNTFRCDLGDNETNNIVILDGEINLLTTTLLFNVNNFIAASIELSALSLSSGFLDGFIEGFHDFFGFSNSGRDLLPPYNLHFVAGKGDGLWINVQGAPMFYVNSFAAKVKFSLPLFMHTTIAVLTIFEIPVSGSQSYVSNSAVDIGIYVLLDVHFHRAAIYLQSGYGRMNKPIQLPEEEFNPDILFFNITFEWIPLPMLSLFLQATGHTSAYQSPHRMIGKPTVYLIPGLKYAAGPGVTWQFSFSEEIVSYSAADFIFSAGVEIGL